MVMAAAARTPRPLRAALRGEVALARAAGIARYSGSARRAALKMDALPRAAA